MPYCLASPATAEKAGTVKRFDARYWTVDFPRPMMASAVTTGPHAVRVEAVFYRADDLAGLIWEAEDRHDHPLLAYETARDFRRCTLRFRWRSGGLVPLDAVHGPTLTIEGRDAAGAARSWYVRLWNYAAGAPEDAAVALDFSALAGGWEKDDPVWAGDVDRMFVSLVAPGYSGAAAPLPAAAEGWCELSDIGCEGSGSVLSIGDAVLPEHGLRIASGYDDSYHLTPARVLRNALALGWRKVVNHYVGMSHYFRLGADLKVTGALNGPCAAWHRDFLARAKALGFEVILSLSYELLDAHCPEDWKQRAQDGAPALTGWSPPSALLSPANAAAMSYLKGVALAFAGLAAGAGQRVRFQVGEPWWWITADGRICLYDAAAVAALQPAPIVDMRAALSPAQKATLDAAGALLAASTASLCVAVKGAHPAAETLLLAYLPTVDDPAMPEAKRANLPTQWVWPAFDVLQLEDYDWVTQGRRQRSRAGRTAAAARLGYPDERQHYFAGFVLRSEDRAQWSRIAGAAAEAAASGIAETFVWALPQVLRDGFVYFDGEADMDSFDDVRFPVALGREASVEPSFSTDVVTTGGGAEQRNSAWADARLRYDAGPGLRSEEDLHALLSFFRARRGAAVGFRFEDPLDNSCHRHGRRRADRIRACEAIRRAGAADHAARCGIGAPLGCGRRAHGRVGAGGRRDRRLRCRSGGGAGGARGLSLRRAGALCRGPARLQPRDVPGRRNSVRAAGRDQGGGAVSIVDKPLTTIAFCWRIERGDGVALGFTSHDRHLSVGGFLYRSAPGILPSAVGLSTGFEIDRLEVRGALTSDAIRADDLACGRWDGARLSMFIVDWEDPAAEPMPVARGALGDVVLRGSGFEAELCGPAAALERPVVEQTSPECRAQLGDKRCRVDMAARVRVTRIAAVTAETVVEIEAGAGGDYGHGRLRWLGGANCGLSCAVAASAGSVLTLRDPPHFPAEAGDLVEVAEGCDKSFAVCAGRFGNALNFRGEPHLPGGDLLSRYAGA
jgi:uncharacterized phage protein (TIGR02218 family)